MSDNLEPDYEGMKRRLDVEEQALRVEKLRRELHKEDAAKTARNTALLAARNGAGAFKRGAYLAFKWVCIAAMFGVAFKLGAPDSSGPEAFVKSTSGLLLAAAAFVWVIWDHKGD